MSWKCLEDINRELFGNDPLTLAKDCFSVFSETKGILLVLSPNKVYSIKLTTDDEKYLKVSNMAIIKDVKASSVVQDTRNSFLLTRDKRIFAFKTFKKVFELPNYANTKLLQCFNDSCYILVRQIECEVRIQLYKTFGESDDPLPEQDFDLSLSPNPASSSRDDDQISIEFIEGPLSERDAKFFSELLLCDFESESIVDVLLVSVDDKLLWIKYSGSFREGSSEHTIDTITTANGNIRGINYCEGSLLMLDGFTLSAFYLCQLTKIIRKKEIPLIGSVKCFRFYRNMFIYSNMKKILFVDVTNPQLPVTTTVTLKGIVCFTIVESLNIIIAICHNQMFYYVPIESSLANCENKNNFRDLNPPEIEMIPSIAKFIESEESKLLEIEQKAKELQNLKILLHHQLKNKDFQAGEASVKFHQTIPKFSESSIICKISNQPIGSEFIEMTIKLSKLLANFSLTLMVHQHSDSGVTSRAIKFINSNEFVHILMPSEQLDNSKIKMSLELNFSYDIKGQTRLLVFPITIKELFPFNGPRIKLKNRLDECLAMIDKMKL